MSKEPFHHVRSFRFLSNVFLMKLVKCMCCNGANVMPIWRIPALLPPGVQILVTENISNKVVGSPLLYPPSCEAIMQHRRWRRVAVA